MRKRNASNSNYEYCCICFPTDDEVIFIINGLEHQISKLFEKTNKQQQDHQSSKLQFLDFPRLIKMIFGKRFKNLKSTASCSHSDLKKHLGDKIGCSDKQLDRISTHISWKLARFQFHTDAIVAQSKTFLRHFTHDENAKETEALSSNNKKSSSLELYQVKQENSEKQSKSEKGQLPEKEGNIGLYSNQEMFYNLSTYLWQFSCHPFQLLMPPPEVEEENFKQKRGEVIGKQQKLFSNHQSQF